MISSELRVTKKCQRSLLKHIYGTKHSLSVGTTLITPAGIPAAWASLARASADNGVSEGGLITTVQPTAIAGATFI